jgi:hypothetical protein
VARKEWWSKALKVGGTVLVTAASIVVTIITKGKVKPKGGA